MKKSAAITLLTVILLATWLSSLYVFQKWGFERGKDSREVLLCQDALDRRIEAESALNQPVHLATGAEIPLASFADIEGTYDILAGEAARLRSHLTDVERDIAHYCADE